MFKVICFLMLALSVGAVPKGSLTGASQVIIPQSGVNYSSFNLASNILGSLARDAEIITPTDAPDYGLTSYASTEYRYFSLSGYVIIKGEIIPLVAYSFPDMVVTEPTTNYPAGFAAFTPNVTNRTPYVGSPEIAEWTRQNDPGDTMALTGEELDGDFAGFYYYSEDAAGFGDIQRLDGRQAAVTLPSTLSTNDFNLMWPMNANGFGYPVGINQTELWWMNDQFSTGDTFSVYGQNLDLGDDDLCQVYIVGHGWVTNTSANPYKADFVCPALTNGSYTLYAHNGHGGKYGWSEAQTFTVVDQIVWDDDTNTWFDVTDYGATGDGVTDDTSAINDAASAAASAADYSTVYFPAGDYLVSDRIYPNDGRLRYKGDGMTNSTLVGSSVSFSSYDVILEVRENSAVEDLGFNKGDLDVGCITSQGGGYRTNVELNRVKISCLSTGPIGTVSGGSPLKLNSADNWKMTDCRFIVNFAINGGAGRKLIFKNCEFIGAGDSNGLMSFYGQNMAFIDCAARPLDPTDPNDDRGWAEGRWLYGDGTMRNLYIGGNTSTNLVPRKATVEFEEPIISLTGPEVEDAENVVTFNSGDLSTVTLTAFIILESPPNGSRGYEISSIDVSGQTVTFERDWYDGTFDTSVDAKIIESSSQNSGEQFLFEGMDVEYAGKPTTVIDASTIAFSDLTLNKANQMFFITDGQGMGQSVRISTNSTAAGTVTLTEPLRVLPDATSMCKIGHFLDRVAFYDNDIVGSDRVATAGVYTATTAMNVYGGSSRVVADGNRISKLRTGLFYWANSDEGVAQIMQPNLFNVVKNNTIDNCQYGLGYVVQDWGRIVPNDVTLYGHVIRGNTITNSTVKAVSNSTSAGGKRKDLCVYDGNIITKNFISVNDSVSYDDDDGSLDPSVVVTYNQVWVGNEFVGTGTETGIVFGVTNSPALQDNTFADFALTYGANAPGAVLELPQRTGYTNSSEITITAFNSGTADADVVALGVTNTVTAGSSDDWTGTFTTATNFPFTIGSQSKEFYVIAGGGGTPPDTNTYYAPFNGTDDYVLIDIGGEPTNYFGACVITADIRPNVGANQTVFAGGASALRILILADGELMLNTSAIGVFLEDAERVELAVTFESDGDAVALSTNGVSAWTGRKAYTDSDEDNIYIGARNSGGAGLFFDGDLFELSIDGTLNDISVFPTTTDALNESVTDTDLPNQGTGDMTRVAE